MHRTTPLPLFARGLGRVKLALKSTLQRAPSRTTAPLDIPCRWQDTLLSPAGPVISDSRSLADLGYARSPHPNIASGAITGLSVVHRLLTAEAVATLQRICTGLEHCAGNSDWIISRRTRGATALSPFLHGMMHSRAFLLAVSRIAGVPLLPYPMVNARAQVNYFYPACAGQPREQVGMWHTDGTNYVLNLVLSNAADYSGGQFLFHNHTIDTFDVQDCRSVEAAPLNEAGDALFLYGSRVFHGVCPVQRGRRMSLVLSFHCPYARQDSNRFWHLASDDGIAATLPHWLRLRWTVLTPAQRQFAALGIVPITFEELGRAEARRC
ncbi:2OG-Fe(II) oxygenase family protein [Stenotrophomonas rhizophila]|uniref:2OG-Fe(II) oxygenase family protein n=1 Tax=Stenotrophomonas rhizophila TaxID=216778 RepID=UPI001E3E29C7|nr:2OG-Fe(II) oxygenase family protein [Stenotrophomonas rhizophila]MCC7635582.1 2OG-Fe(II) oxygenase [Stenotrophomonas rhizophila]MCC7664209.1 2OG-Fe(II) oxygenase [Stenotrophomonas rhizophila]